MKKPHLNIIPPTLLLAISALLSSVLGVVRDRLLAKTFGATSGEGLFNLDTYYAAFKIPDLLYFILISGAISASFIPIFTQYKKAGETKKAWQFASNMLHLMLLIVSVIALVAFIFAPQLTRLVADGFEPEAFELTVRLMRIMLLSPIILTFSAVFMSLQDSFKTFFYRALFPLFYNVGIIVSILFFARDYGVVGVTWGVILGALIGMLIQLPALKQISYKHMWLLDTQKSDIRQALKMMVPRTLSTGMYQISQVFYTRIASFLATGSITIIYFANNLYTFPLSIIAVSFSITSFATLSELAVEKTPHAFAAEIKRVMRQVLFLVIPATIGMMLLREPIINTLLLTGEFTAQDATLTAQVLIVLLLSLFTHSLNLLLVRGFFAFHDTKRPFYANAVGAVAGVALAYLLSDQWGMVGIGWGMTASNLITFSILLILMYLKVKTPVIDYLNTGKMLLISLVMGLGVWLAMDLIPFPSTLFLKFLYLILISLMGGVIYLCLAWLFKIPERKMIYHQLDRLVKK